MGPEGTLETSSGHTCHHSKSQAFLLLVSISCPGGCTGLGKPVTFFFFFCFLGPHPWHVEVPRLGVSSELQLPAYTTATATPDLSRICDLHHSSQQRLVLNPLSEAKHRTCVLMNASQVHFH